VADAADDPADPVRTLVRWTFCKNDTTLATAAERLSGDAADGTLADRIRTARSRLRS
ncbi:MAG TPA: aminotransferase, partial [Corynebacterium nuruki]|nr:aminotransferase [Corynebacterium nuruki]